MKLPDPANCVASHNFHCCKSLEKFSKINNFLLFFSINRDPSFNARGGKAVSENEITSSLPAEPEQRSARLYDLALETINNFLSSHSLQVKFPAETTQEVSRAIDEGETFDFSSLMKI